MPGANPSVGNNADSPTSSVPSVQQLNSWNCSSTVDGNGDYPCSLGRASIPLPNKDNATRTASISSTGSYQSLGCIAIDANQFTAYGRGFRYTAYGNLSINTADSPTLQFRTVLFTNSTCGAGATQITQASAFTASSGTISSTAWELDVDLNYAGIGTNNWGTGGRVVASINSAGNPIDRLFNPSTAVAFDPTTCTGAVCGFRIEVQASSGGVANTPTVVKNFDVLEYR